jgi:hypothetical protein
MFFLLNDIVLTLDLTSVSVPMGAGEFAAISIDKVLRLGQELYAKEPRLQHGPQELPRRLCSLIVAKSPHVNAALFVAPSRNCKPDEVGVRLASVDTPLLFQLQHDQQHGLLTSAMVDDFVWGQSNAA